MTYNLDKGKEGNDIIWSKDIEDGNVANTSTIASLTRSTTGLGFIVLVKKKTKYYF